MARWYNTMMILDRDFYSKDTVTVACDLLGKRLVRILDDVTLSGIISETEAYGHVDDPASHARRKMTKRNAAMFGEVGRAYVYFTYGMHYCFNVVARSYDAAAGAVLIRAIIPDTGIDTMIQNRGRKSHLADGPAKLAQALCITKREYGADLTIPESLYIEDGPKPQRVVASPRVGVKDPHKWNYSIVS